MKSSQKCNILKTTSEKGKLRALSSRKFIQETKSHLWVTAGHQKERAENNRNCLSPAGPTVQKSREIQGNPGKSREIMLSEQTHSFTCLGLQLCLESSASRRFWVCKRTLSSCWDHFAQEVQTEPSTSFTWICICVFQAGSPHPQLSSAQGPHPTVLRVGKLSSSKPHPTGLSWGSWDVASVTSVLLSKDVLP